MAPSPIWAPHPGPFPRQRRGAFTLDGHRDPSLFRPFNLPRFG